MLVSSMTIEEIRKDLSKDYPVLLRKAGHVAHRLKKFCWPLKDKIVSRVYDYLSFNKNKWIYHVSLSKDKEEYQFFVYHYGRKGLCAYCKGDQSDYLMKFTAHFFQRYNKRMELGLTCPEEIIRTYISSNSVYVFENRRKIKDGITKIFCVTQQGVILGTKEEKRKVYHMNTFIPLCRLNRKKEGLIQKVLISAYNIIKQFGKPEIISPAIRRAA